MRKWRLRILLIEYVDAISSRIWKDFNKYEENRLRILLTKKEDQYCYINVYTTHEYSVRLEREGRNPDISRF